MIWYNKIVDKNIFVCKLPVNYTLLQRGWLSLNAVVEKLKEKVFLVLTNLISTTIIIGDLFL